MELKQIIKKAYLDGIIEGGVMAKVNMNFDTDGMSEYYAETELKKLRVADVIKNGVAVCDPHGCLNYSQGYDRCKKQCERCKDL